ncbi:uncharacterized protein K460DRAFT_399107 [Cucurbitaria berberidis CBS 394.84]|uniref:BTB domain-containing protein n=1 Tax=Cucurbitaria berberidis CBS 394.84 TaxID=1168544 RepID=A0A9P4G6S3_9PLEO|nr:uncharacterized protein K460DRAFT_399107 [Cucurbitaria berberidis CBS 394.84]KAF1840073.1 hypothetical protein K460DRAFT_399107 [Cucurbitaria berberidis CBS 394.84]
MPFDQLEPPIMPLIAAVQDQPQPMSVEGLSKECLRDLYMTGHFSDVIIKYHDLEIKAHKLVLAAKSSILKRLFDQQPSKIELGALKALISFCYTGDPTDLRLPDDVFNATWDRFVDFYVSVFVHAHTFKINDLVVYSGQQFRDAAYTFLKTLNDDEAIEVIADCYAGSATKNDGPHFAYRIIGLHVFGRRILALLRDNKFEKAFQYMIGVQEATADLFSQTTFDGKSFTPKDGRELFPTRTWSCDGCGTEHRYAAMSEPSAKFQICPCCITEEQQEAIRRT